MKFITLSASHSTASASLFQDEAAVMTVEAGRSVQPSFWFAEAVEMLARHAGVSLSGLDFVAVDVGPGSFTGIKVAISFAQGISTGSRLPLVAVNSLEMDATVLTQGTTGLFVREANKGLRYYTVCRKDPGGTRIIIPPSAATSEDIAAEVERLSIEELWLIGEKIEIPSCTVLFLNDMTPGSKKMGPVALSKFTGGRVLTPETIKPLYVRPPDAKISQPR